MVLISETIRKRQNILWREQKVKRDMLQHTFVTMHLLLLRYRMKQTLKKINSWSDFVTLGWGG